MTRFYLTTFLTRGSGAGYLVDGERVRAFTLVVPEQPVPRRIIYAAESRIRVEIGRAAYVTSAIARGLRLKKKMAAFAAAVELALSGGSRAVLSVARPVRMKKITKRRRCCTKPYFWKVFALCNGDQSCHESVQSVSGIASGTAVDVMCSKGTSGVI